MTVKNGYFNYKAETMKDAAQRYVGVESYRLMHAMGVKIDALAKSNHFDPRLETELRESVQKSLSSGIVKFMNAFSSLLYSEEGKDPQNGIRKVAGEAVLKYEQLLRESALKANRAESRFQISGSLMQFGIDVEIITGEMARSLKEINRK